jgi:hypothetical protein
MAEHATVRWRVRLTPVAGLTVDAGQTRDTTIPITGTLTIGLGVPRVTTSTDIAINPAVYSGRDDDRRRHLRTKLHRRLRTRHVGPGNTGLASFDIPLAGLLANLHENLTRSSEASAPTGSITVGGVTVPIDRVNDVSVFLA